MQKLNKSKKGFTLLEMVTVIAIIVILATVLIYAVNKIIEVSKDARDNASNKVETMKQTNAEMSSKIKTYGF